MTCAIDAGKCEKKRHVAERKAGFVALEACGINLPLKEAYHVCGQKRDRYHSGASDKVSCLCGREQILFLLYGQRRGYFIFVCVQRCFISVVRDKTRSVDQGGCRCRVWPVTCSISSQ
ncbi:hypothetical protein KP79_PYT00955 [Mizuhopecten yessoensis]|uniref:Uncharacterized protein n=1 Tax=Mizuhopecten yessoensis TaxID=6573 RepID=A0A210QMJ4_MIZYE|nr:hypothetical protein KP79_PYT00955 [Mizuhopecten yessoensis]